jgi:hypothetical protein
MRSDHRSSGKKVGGWLGKDDAVDGTQAASACHGILHSHLSQ